MVYNYAAVGVSGSQKGDNFRVMDRVLIGAFDITAVSQYTCGCRMAGEPQQWTGNKRFIFLLPLSRASGTFRTFFFENAAFTSLG